MPVEPWFVYLVECSDGSLYAGVARDVARRVSAHNAGRGARYTRGRRPVRVVGTSPPLDKREAHRVEFALKRKPRRAKLAALRAVTGASETPRRGSPGSARGSRRSKA